MKTVIIEYAKVNPGVLAARVEKAFACLCDWHDVDEDFFEFIVIGVPAYLMAELEDTLAEYV